MTLGACAAFASPALGATLTVPGQSPTIQGAIAAAANGDTILVAPGTYTEAVDFLGKTITLQSTDGPAVTTIHPPTPVTAVRMNGTGANAALRGFTVRGGPPADQVSLASAVDAMGSSGVIEGNEITGAFACGAPGLRASGGAVIRRNLVWGNENACTGGGLVSIVEVYSGAVFSDNLVTANADGNGAVGLAGGTATRNIVAGNSSSAAVIFQSGELSNNLVYAHAGAAAAVKVDGFGGTGGVIAGNTFTEDVLHPGGAGISTLLPETATGYVVRGNVFDYTLGWLIECRPVYSTVTPLFEANAFRSGTGTVAAPGSCASPVGTGGNVAVDPGFADRVGGDFHLASGSPLIDAGVPGGVTALDGDGDPRPLDGAAGPVGAQWDIGFDEAVQAGNTVATAITAGPIGTVAPGTHQFVVTSPTPGATLQCDVDMAGFTPCASPVTVTATDSRFHSFRVRAISPAGVVDRSPATRLYQVDATPPTTTVTGPPRGVPGTDVWEVPVSSDDPAAVFECAVDGAPFEPCGPPVRLTVGRGSHTLLVRAVDAAGNADATPANVQWTAICTLFGTLGPESLTGGDDADGLCGDEGDDALHGHGGADLLDGGGGNDILNGGPGEDHLIGGPGLSDVADYSDRVAPVRVALGLPSGGAEDGAGDTIDFSVEDVWGGAGADVLAGNGRDNFINGGGGGDVILGGLGFDAADYSDATTPVVADIGGAPRNDGRAGEGDTVEVDVEALIGGDGGDTLSAGADSQALVGGGGDDRLTPGPGSDEVLGDGGNDIVSAFDGSVDTVDCGPGADTVYADAFDIVGGCETRVTGPAPSGPVFIPPPSFPGSPAPPPPPPPAPPPFAPAPVASRVTATDFAAAATGTSRAVTVPVLCSSAALASCRVRVTLTARPSPRGRAVVLGSVSRDVPEGRPTAMRVPLTAAARALVSRRPALRVTVTGAVLQGGVFRTFGTRVITLRRSSAAAKERLRGLRILRSR